MLATEEVDHLLKAFARGCPIVGPTDFARTYEQGDWNAVKAKLPLFPFSSQFIVLAHCGHVKHFVLIKVDKASRRAELLDSLRGPSGPRTQGAVLAVQRLQEAFKRTYGHDLTVVDVPCVRQLGVDCGLQSVRNAMLLLSGEDPAASSGNRLLVDAQLARLALVVRSCNAGLCLCGPEHGARGLHGGCRQNRVASRWRRLLEKLETHSRQKSITGAAAFWVGCPSADLKWERRRLVAILEDAELQAESMPAATSDEAEMEAGISAQAAQLDSWLKETEAAEPPPRAGRGAAASGEQREPAHLNVDAWRCICGALTEARMAACLEAGHGGHSIPVAKRFYACRNCTTLTYTLDSRFVSRNCAVCKGSNFDQVPPPPPPLACPEVAQKEPLALTVRMEALERREAEATWMAPAASLLPIGGCADEDMTVVDLFPNTGKRLFRLLDESQSDVEEEEEEEEEEKFAKVRPRRTAKALRPQDDGSGFVPEFNRFQPLSVEACTEEPHSDALRQSLSHTPTAHTHKAKEKDAPTTKFIIKLKQPESMIPVTCPRSAPPPADAPAPVAKEHDLAEMQRRRRRKENRREARKWHALHGAAADSQRRSRKRYLELEHVRPDFLFTTAKLGAEREEDGAPRAAEREPDGHARGDSPPPEEGTALPPRFALRIRLALAQAVRAGEAVRDVRTENRRREREAAAALQAAEEAGARGRAAAAAAEAAAARDAAARASKAAAGAARPAERKEAKRKGMAAARAAETTNEADARRLSDRNGKQAARARKQAERDAALAALPGGAPAAAAAALQMAVLDSSGYSLHAPSEFLNHQNEETAKAAEEATLQSIADHVYVSDARKDELMQKAEAHLLSDKVKIHACASCGIREVALPDGGDGWSEVPLSDLPPQYRFSEEQAAARAALGTIPQLDKDGKLVHLNGFEYVTSYEDDNNILWHLYPSFVDSELKSACVCKSCLNGIRKKEPSDTSLAGGCDFGKALTEKLKPSLIECLLLADVRLYALIVKVTKGGAVLTGDMRVLNGHIVSFMQSGATAAAGALSFDSVDDLLRTIQVVFVGPEGDRDLLAERLRNCPFMQVNVKRIYNLLQIRNVLRGLQLNIPSVEELEQRLGNVTEQLLKNAQTLTEKDIIQEDESARAKCSDVAHVREGAEDNLPHVAIVNPHPSVQAELRSTLSAIRDAVYPGDGSGAPLAADGGDGPAGAEAAEVAGAEAEAAAETVVGANQAAAMDSDAAAGAEAGAGERAAGEPPPSARVFVPRAEEPICEFTCNGEMLEGAFWWLSLLGHGLNIVSGPLSPKRTRHLCLFHDNRFAECKQLLFTLANQHMRHSCARGVAATWRNSPDVARKFADLRQEPGLQAKLDAAVANPSGPEAKEVLRRILPLLSIAARKVPWSGAERKYVQTFLIALARWHGPGAVFLTASPDDIHGQVAIRLTVAQKDNISFPAVDGGLQEALATGQTTLGHVDLSLAEAAVRARGASNPVATSEAFRLIMDVLTRVLLGLASDQDSKKTKPMSEREKGIMGTPVAYYFVCETSGRLALHGHGITFGGPTTQLLLNVAEHENIMAKLTEALNTLACGMVSPMVHAVEALRVGLSVRGARVPMPRAAYRRAAPSAASDPELWSSYVDAAAHSSNRHRHCDTCHKGKTGLLRCRGGIKKPHPVQKTEIVQLLPPRPPRGAVGGEEEDEDMETQGGPVVEREVPRCSQFGGCCPSSRRSLAVRVVKPRPRKLYMARLVPRDMRVLNIELVRPLVDPPAELKKIATNEAAMSMSDIEALKLLKEALATPEAAAALKNDDVATPELRRRLDNVTGPEARRIIHGLRKLSCANAKIAEYNDVLTAALRCNNAVVLLGGGECARACMYYMVKYVTKNSVELAASLSVFAGALKHVEKYKSKAEDSGTSERDARYWSQRILNSLQGAMELSDTQAAAMLLNATASVGSCSFRYFQFWPLMKLAVESQPVAADGGEDDSAAADEDNGADAVPVLPEDMSGLHELGEDDAHGDGGDGTAVRYMDAEGETILVNPALHYKFRGAELAALSAVEYYMGVSVVPVSDTKPAAEDDAHEAVEEEGEVDEEKPAATPAARRGRNTNQTWPFDSRHPLHNIYEQKAKSKFPVLIWAGRPPPKSPPAQAEGQVDTPARRKAGLHFARCILSAFRPWDAVTGNAGELSEEELLDWLDELRIEAKPAPPGGDPPEQATRLEAARQVARARLFIIHNFSHGLAVTNKSRMMSSDHRLRDVDRWSDKESSDGDESEREEAARGNGDGVDSDDDNERSRLAKRIEELRAAAEAREFNPKKVQDAYKNKDWLDEAKRRLSGVFAEADAAAAERRRAATDDAAFAAAAAKSAGGAPPSGGTVLRASRDALESVLAEVQKQRTHEDEEAVDAAGVAARRQQLGPDFTPPEFVDITEEAFEAEAAAWAAAAQAGVEADPPLNPQQRLLARRVFRAAFMADTGRRQGLKREVYMKDVDALHLLLGAGGVGKSVGWAAVRKAMQQYGLGGAVATSFMGCAAAPLNGSTLCSLLTLTGDDCARNKPKEKVSQADITTFELLCGCPRTKLTVLFVDELSTVGGIFAGNIDQTLRLIMECTGLAMGGLIVIFAGDFLQKPPSVPKTPWFSSLVSVDAYGAPAPSADSSMVHGLALMRSLRLATFTRQMRTDDAAHQKMLTELRRLDAEPVFSRAVLNSLQFITPRDVARDPGWMFAPIGVISNQERILYNYMQAKRWAQYYNVPLIRWPLKLSGSTASSLSAEEMKLALDNELGLWGYYVEGAPAMVTENIPRTNKGIVNGALGWFHSLCWATNALSDAAEELIGGAGYREVLLPATLRPYTVNVQLTRPANAPAWRDEDSLVSGAAVVPLKETIHVEPVKLTSPESLVAGLPMLKTMPHTACLAFARTDYKLQGVTLSHLLLSLSARSFQPYIDMSGAYVLASRVRSGAGLKVLPLPHRGTLDHLQQLSWPQELRVFAAGWNDQGCWDASLSKAAVAELAPRGRKRRATATAADVESDKRARAKVVAALKEPSVRRRIAATAPTAKRRTVQATARQKTVQPPSAARPTAPRSTPSLSPHAPPPPPPQSCRHASEPNGPPAQPLPPPPAPMQAELTTNLRDLATQLRRRVGEVPLRRAVNYPRRGDSDAVPLEQRDVLTLLPRTFLNDNMVDFCLKRVRAELPAGEAVRPLPRAPLQR